MGEVLSCFGLFEVGLKLSSVSRGLLAEAAARGFDRS